jgi:hypothetical protein
MLELTHIQSRNIRVSYVDVLFTFILSTFHCHVIVYHYIIYLIFIFHSTHFTIMHGKMCFKLTATESAHSLLSGVGMALEKYADV